MKVHLLVMNASLAISYLRMHPVQVISILIQLVVNFVPNVMAQNASNARQDTTQIVRLIVLVISSFTARM